ncbi:hypothetical protein RHSIM_Rhsim04G0147700 [Rhododendron simsii]|uniref:RING-type E3 ubiquitin transferase n=1 Tax=Rhododendron simsii TaxID=118357 RepID=A0A834LQL2_RHOSS|nr:hypothetical protein RHSIM_Rhsim04G0147700 [Rhododendron simsii]
MGNTGSSNVNGRRRHGSRRRHPPPLLPQQPQPEMSANHYVFAAATPYPAQFPNQNPNPHPYYPYPGYYPPPPPPMAGPLPASYDHHHSPPHMYPCGPVLPSPPPYVEHQKAVTIRNDVNLKKESLRMEQDEKNPGQFLVAFTFDATVAGRYIFLSEFWFTFGISFTWPQNSITVLFFAKEAEDCILTPTKENLLAPVTVHFEEGLGQKFRQPSGTGIDFSTFEETDLLEVVDMEVHPLAVKAETSPVSPSGSEGEHVESGTPNSQITKAVFEKERGEYKVRVVKQIVRVNQIRYELQEIYGIGDSADGDFDGNDPSKECVICLSEPRDTTVLPCRHMVLSLSLSLMCIYTRCGTRRAHLYSTSFHFVQFNHFVRCMCSSCAKVLRLQTNRCPICRQPVDKLLEIKVNNGPEESSVTSV